MLTGKIQEYNTAAAKKALEKSAQHRDSQKESAVVLEELKEEYRRSSAS